MIRFGLCAVAVVMAPAAPAQTIESALGDWSDIPEMPDRTRMSLSNDAMERIDTIVAQGQCPSAGSKNKIRLDMPVLVQFNRKGEPRKVVVRKIGCPEVEQIIGNAALQIAKAGRYKPTGENQTGWYRSEISYRFN